ncbi:MAG: hypothetical protein V5A64_04555, partial [Candidatus Thermoplasmatota archaeon]
YLAEYHNKKNTFFSVPQNKFDLCHDVEKAKDTSGVQRRCNVDRSVENIFDVVFSAKESAFR